MAMEISNIINFFMIILAIVTIFTMGWISCDFYKVINLEKQLDGLWFNNYNYTSAREKAYELDNSGQWVCINVDITMDYDRCVKIASHECGHELWANICGKDPLLCIQGQELLNDYQNKTKE